MNKVSVTVVSSYATDRIIKDGKIISSQPGGPAFFLEQAFRKAGCNVKVITGTKLLVDILLVGGNELGRINQDVVPRKIPRISLPNVVISTLLKEWDPFSVESRKARVFIDVQGYVRDGTDFGKKKRWEELGDARREFFCIKGTQHELEFIPRSVLESQKERLLISTKGKEGVDVYYLGKFYRFKPSRVVSSAHTIGAGDTFFANFIASFIVTEDLELSLKKAMERTASFLEKVG